MDLILTGRIINAAEAKASGLVARVVPAAELLQTALEATHTIAGYNAPAVRMAKEAVNRAHEVSLAEGLIHERRLFQAAFATDGQKEEMHAFLSKRVPVFRHRRTPVRPLIMKSTDAPRSHVQRRGARSNTREHLIRAGLESVLENGWAGTSVEKVLTTVGVPKGSFYHYFGSKDDFGFALLETYQAYFLRRLERCFGARPNGVNPSFTHKLAAFLSESTVGMRRFRWRRGCLVGTLGQEVAGLHDGFRKRLDASIREWETQLSASIRMAQAGGEVRANFDADRLARSFWAAWEGAVLRARLARSAAPLVLVVEDFDQLIHI